jgi:hypothetical protein
MARFLCCLALSKFISGAAFLAAFVAIVPALLKACDTCLLEGLARTPELDAEGCELRRHGCYWCPRFIILYGLLCLIGCLATAVHRCNAKADSNSPDVLPSASLPEPEPASPRPKRKPEAAIWRLPPELIHLVAKYLPPSAVAAFSLTSKTAQFLVGEQFLESLNYGDRLALLELLQSDMPNHLLCYQCSTFHHKASIKDGMHRDCGTRNGYILWGETVLLFTDAQQVMNSHLYGRSHVLSPGVVFCQDHTSGSKSILKEITELRVSGDDVLLRRQIHAGGRWGALGKRRVKGRPFRLCSHISYAEEFNPTPGEWVYLICPTCETEIEAIWSVGEHQDYLSLYMWSSLGRCRNPYETQWCLSTNGSRGPSQPLRRTFRNGEVMLRFHSSPPIPPPKPSGSHSRERAANYH